MKNIATILSALAICAACTCGQPSQWAPAGDNIRTRWAAEVSAENAHPEYPRPQMVRDSWMSLNGLWDYSVSPIDSVASPDPEGKILVPFCIESSLSGVGRKLGADEALWYSREFKLPCGWRKQRVLLHFEAVDWKAEVYVNGNFVGSHTGGYGAFEMDVTDALVKKGPQTLVVRVEDATDNDFQPRGKQVSDPRSIWYTQVSGIWQSVWLESVPATYIGSYTATARLDGGCFDISVNVNDAMDGDKVVVRAGDGSSEAEVCDGAAALSVKLESPQLWSPDDPYLYDLDIKLLRGGKVVDKVKGYSAMREISTIVDSAGHKRMALNGKPIFMYGPLDQGWWPDGLYTAPTYEAMVFDIDMTKEYGFNMIRKHIKVEPATWYRACDERGILVWQDMPSFADNHKNDWAQNTNAYDTGTDWPATEEIKANFRKEWAEIMDQHMSYPCIVVWVPFNEAWGQFDTKDIVEFTRSLDSTRLINHASGGNWVSGGVGDILDSHHYPGPQMRVTDENMINVLGEYGGIGLPVEGHLWQKDRNWGYVQYADTDAVTDEYVNFSEMLRPLVIDGCSAAVYTQTTDVEGEVNGLMTYDREVIKLDLERACAANRSIIEILL